MRFDSLINAVYAALQQELDILSELPDELYRAPANGPFTSSIGMHLRHNLDHFEAFFTGLPIREIDYETRGRNTMIEESVDTATAVLGKCLSKLEALRSHEEVSLQIREESDASSSERAWLSSSFGRELQFLLSHTVHHNALIAMIMHGFGIALPASFGIAPSTQRHEQGCQQSST